MNLVTETKKRLEKAYQDKEDYLNILELDSISIDARIYIRSKLDYTNKNIEYYTRVLEMIGKWK